MDRSTKLSLVDALRETNRMLPKVDWQIDQTAMLVYSGQVDALIAENERIEALAESRLSGFKQLAAENEQWRVDWLALQAENERLRAVLEGLLRAYAPAAFDGSQHAGDPSVVAALAVLGKSW